LWEGPHQLPLPTFTFPGIVRLCATAVGGHVCMHGVGRAVAALLHERRKSDHR